LWQLNPSSLKWISRHLLPSSGGDDGIDGTMAAAGAWLWVGVADRVVRVSLSIGATTGEVMVPGAMGVDVASDAAGRVLVDSAGHEEARIQLRDPVTGGVVRQSHLILGVTKPYIGGVIDGGVWFSEAGGSMGYVRRVQLSELTSTGDPEGEASFWSRMPPTLLEGSNGIRAAVVDGMLLVSQVAGGAQSNYCGDPVTGQDRAPLRLPPFGVPAGLIGRTLYYLDEAGRWTSLGRVALSPRCFVQAPRSPIRPPGPGCTTGISLSLGPFVSPMTGEHALSFVIRNRNGYPCQIDGYPAVDFMDGRDLMRFAYDPSGGQYVTSAPPRQVDLAPGGHAYFLVAKYRCDGQIAANATSVFIGVDGIGFTLALRRSGVGQISYCRRYRGDAKIDPGNHLEVSPYEPSFSETVRTP
jgi:hypothetical protein